MARQQDPIDAIRKKALTFDSVIEGLSCNQSSFKVGKGSFLFLGPGAKGVGYKAMFRLDRSMDHARELAQKEPGRFEVGKTGWVTARFTDEKPLPRLIWQKWVKESYEVACGSGARPAAPGAKAAKKLAKTAAKKKPTRSR